MRRRGPAVHPRVADHERPGGGREGRDRALPEAAAGDRGDRSEAGRGAGLRRVLRRLRLRARAGEGVALAVRAPPTVLVAVHEEEIGGATRALLRVLPLMRERGWQFVFWAPCPSALADELTADGLVVHG